VRKHGNLLESAREIIVMECTNIGKTMIALITATGGRPRGSDRMGSPGSVAVALEAAITLLTFPAISGTHLPPSAEKR